MNKTLAIIIILSIAIVILSTAAVVQCVEIQKLRFDNDNLKPYEESAAAAQHFLMKQRDDYNKLRSQYERLLSDYNKLKLDDKSPQTTPIAP